MRFTYNKQLISQFFVYTVHFYMQLNLMHKMFNTDYIKLISSTLDKSILTVLSLQFFYTFNTSYYSCSQSITTGISFHLFVNK